MGLQNRDNQVKVSQPEIEYKKQLLFNLSWIITFGALFGVIALLITLYITAQPLLLYSLFTDVGAVLLCLSLNLLIKQGFYRLSSWLLILIMLIAILVPIYFLATQVTIVVMLIIPCISSTLILKRVESIALASFCMLITILVYVSTDIWHLYVPPILLSNEGQTFLRIALVLIVIPLSMALLLFPTKNLLIVVQHQNEQLQNDIITRERAQQALQLLSESSKSLTRSLVRDDILKTLLSTVSTVGINLTELSLFFRIEDTRIRCVAIMTANPLIFPFIGELPANFSLPWDKFQPYTIALQEGKSILNPPFLDSVVEPTSVISALRTVLNGLKYYAIPLLARDHLFGFSLIVLRQTDSPYHEEDLHLIEEISYRAAMALDNARLYEQAQQAIKAREEFFSVAAHELKTPITSLQGYAQLLQRLSENPGPTDATQFANGLTMILKQAKKLTRLIIDLLDVSRFQANKLAITKVSADLIPIVTDVLAGFKTAINQELYTITLEAPGSLVFNFDPLRLEQVLINLIGNALKFSPEGGLIRISIGLLSPELIMLSVADEGIGVPLEHREHIFEPFYQAHASSYLGGLGIGLFVSRQIVELHGGQLTAEFPPEGGTTFILALPVS